jgi:hypothetical protein
MGADGTSDSWQDLNKALVSGNWTGAKPLVERLLSVGDRPDSVERAALAALVEGGAFNRLEALSAEARATWLAEQIVLAARARDKIKANHLAFDLRTLLKQTGVMIDEELALKALKGLKSVRAFEALSYLGDRFIALGIAPPEIQKLSAQGLIDLGYPHAGLATLKAMLTTTAADHPQRLDGLGIAGRACKQVYVDASSPPGKRLTSALRAALMQSITYYEDAYLAMRGRRDPRFTEWSYPAINLVAVLKRAEADGVSVPARVNAGQLTRELIEGFHNGADAKESYDLATLGEAFIASKDWQSAEHWLGAYAARPDVDAFQLASTLRQLEEVWRLVPGDDAQGRILLLLKAQLLGKEGGQVLLTPEARQALMAVTPQAGAQPEIYLSDGRPKPVGWFKRGLERTYSVGLMKLVATEEGFATGFLVRGGDFIAHLGDEPVLLTNAHVISERASELNDPLVASVRPQNAQVEFTQASDAKPRKFDLDRILWDSPRSELDACLVAFKSPPTDVPMCRLSDKTPEPGKSRVIIIGHPGGEREMKLSLYETPVTTFGPKGLLATTTDAARMFLRYNNPTIPGNSGSPVFDIDDWSVIGLHHAGSSAQSVDASEGHAAQPMGNEGVFIRSISNAALRGERSSIGVSQPAPPAPRRGSAQSAVEAASPKTSAAQARPGSAKLAHDIPMNMIEGKTVNVTAKMSRLESEGLIAGLRKTDVAIHDVVPYAAMTVTLKALEGNFAIEPLSADTQWLDRVNGKLDDVTTWKWSVKPLKPGRHKLALIVQGREFRDGIEAALPSVEQTIPVTIEVDKSGRAMTVAKWAAVAAGGGVMSWLAQLVMRSMI